MNVNNYILLRKDVVGNVPKHGVCMYVRASYNYTEVDVQVPNVVAAHLPDHGLYIAAIYRPPSNSPAEDERLISFLYNFCLGKEVVLLGDFNLPSVAWSRDLVACGLTGRDSKFYNCFISLGLTQWVTEPTFLVSGNILDLILTSEDDRVGEVQVLPPFPNCGHSPVLCSYIFHDVPSSQETFIHRLWHRGKYNKINWHLSFIDWDFEFMDLNTDAMFIRFINILTPLIDRYIPIMEFNEGTHNPKWNVRPPQLLKRRRHLLWNQYKVTRSRYGRNSDEAIGALRLFQDVNYQFRNFVITKQAEYEASIVESLTHNTKIFHAYIRQKKVGKPRIGPLKTDDGQAINDAKSMANIFGAAFSSVYVREAPDCPEPHQIYDGNMGHIDITLDTVEAALSELDVSTSMGPDEIHPCLLKFCRTELAYPLMLIFQATYNTCFLPTLWKKSLIVPIYKKGSRHDPLNYRPVSLTSVCVKSLERILCKHIYEYATSNNLLCNDQFGFRPGRSTEDQLLLTYNAITNALNQGDNVDLILFDFSKAFDTVCHDILLDKLSKLGITGNLLGWIKEFLTNRVMSVIVDHQRSDSYDVHSGVPQGSVLGPLLFLLYINFLTHDIHSSVKIFADDLKMYITVKSDSVNAIIQHMDACQRDINHLHKVASSWGLSMNISKCAVLRFTRRPVDWTALPFSGQYFLNTSPIPIKDSAVDLGVTIDLSLKFHQHIANIVQKAGGVAQNLLKATVNREASFLLPLFIAHIRPLLEYCSSVWNLGYIGDLRLLESVQRRWTKNIQGMENLDYFQRLKALDLYSVQGRLLRHDMVKYWQIFHDYCAIDPEDMFYNPPLDTTRGHQFKIAHVRTELELRKRFFSVRGITLWNSLPNYVVSANTLSAFKASLSAHLGDRLYEFV